MDIHYLKMRIGFDMRPFLKEETGVGIYFKNLLFALAKIDPDNEYYLFSASLKDRFDPRKIPFFARKRFLDLHFPVKAIDFLWYRLGWPPLDFFFKSDLDLTHSPTPVLLPTKGKKIVTVHDLFFLDFPEMSDKQARQIFSPMIQKSLKEADGIVTISHFTKKQIVERFECDKGKLRAIHPGIDLKSWGPSEQDSLERTKTSLALPSNFLLFVGAHEPRKNIPNLLKALKIVHEQYLKIPLVLVGRGGIDSDNILKSIQNLELRPWIKIMGYVDEKALKNIYQLASVFVFPSFCEGFGIPLLEAMASELPIVTSRASALPEIAQDAALYTDPADPEDLATKIIDVLKDNDLRNRLVSAGRRRVGAFSWDKAAAEALDYYRIVLER